MERVRGHGPAIRIGRKVIALAMECKRFDYPCNLSEFQPILREYKFCVEEEIYRKQQELEAIQEIVR